MRILLIANGENSDTDVSEFDKIICIDGGLNYVDSNIVPDVIIGDFDSCDINMIKKFKTSKIVYKNNQDVSDLKFSMQYCLNNYNPDEIVISNAISSDRFDHSICNVLLLKEIPKNIDVKIITKTQEVFILRDKKEIKNLSGKTLSIIPLLDCKNVKTEGLKWNINGDLKFGYIDGISNIIISKTAKISVNKGELLIVIEK